MFQAGPSRIALIEESLFAYGHYNSPEIFCSVINHVECYDPIFRYVLKYLLNKLWSFLFIIKSNRALSLLNDSAEKRYFNLFTERPNLIKEIPLKYIASYIGVTPQSLSRIRKKIT